MWDRRVDMALCEQGARVTALDVDRSMIDEACRHLEGTGLHADFRCANAAHIDRLGRVDFDWVIFWASLEHMLVDERLAALRAAWELLSPGGLLTVIESPTGCGRSTRTPHSCHSSRGSRTLSPSTTRPSARGPRSVETSIPIPPARCSDSYDVVVGELPRVRCSHR